jgi:hypothetical protein
MAKKKSGSEQRQKGALVWFRATAEEVAEITAAAKKVGVSKSEYLRRQSLKKPKPRRPTADTQLMARILGNLAKCGNNINQIAHRLNASEFVERRAIHAALEELKLISTEIVKSINHEATYGDGHQRRVAGRR